MLNGLFSTIVSDFNESSYYVTEAEVMEEMEKLDMLNGYNLTRYFHNIDNPYDACYESMLINQQNYHNIISSIAVMEMNQYQNNNQIIFESVISNIFDKLRDFLNAAWEKLKSIYEKILDLFRGSGGGGSSSSSSSSSSNNSDESKDKHKPIKEVILNNAYKIDPNNISDISKYTDLTNTFSKIITRKYTYGTKGADKIDEIGKKYNSNTRNEAISQYMFNEILNCSDINEFKDNLDKSYGIDEKVNEVKFKIEDIRSYLKNKSDIISSIDKVFKKCKNTFANIKVIIEKKRNEYVKNQTINYNKHTFSTLIEACNISVSILTAMQQRQVKACNIYDSQMNKAAKKVNLL